MDYRSLIAWQKSMDLAEQIYRETASYPTQERFGLTSQMRRAATSIPSNVAEGQGRRSSDGEFVRFLLIAVGSLCELETQLELSSRLKYLTPDRAKKLQPSLEEVGRLLNGLIRSKQH
jgi:four helix bundle protein